MYKILYSLFLLLLIKMNSNAQVYTFLPTYTVFTTYSNYTKTHFFDHVTKFTGSIVIDLDKRIVSTSDDSKARIIEDVKYDATKKVYTLKLQNLRPKSLKWILYYMPLGDDGKPRFIRQAEAHAGNDMKKDTFFETYTGDLKVLQLESKFRKFISTPKVNPSDSISLDSYMTHFNEADGIISQNKFEFTDGYISRTEEKEKGNISVTTYKILDEKYYEDDYKHRIFSIKVSNIDFPKQVSLIIYGYSDYIPQRGYIGLIIQEYTGRKADKATVYFN